MALTCTRACHVCKWNHLSENEAQNVQEKAAIYLPQCHVEWFWNSNLWFLPRNIFVLF